MRHHLPGSRIGSKLKTLIIGGARNIFDPGIFHSVTLIAFFAWVGLGADGLSSASYGPEEAFLALGAHTHLTLFVALASGITVFVISAGYAKIIELFPSGGGGYLVASKLHSPTAGMVSGCALLIDYVLTITISVASGADYVFSFLPEAWLPFKLYFAVFAVLAMIVLNLRGVKESIVPLVPIFLVFIVTHAFMILYALFSHASNVPQVVAETSADIRSTSLEMGVFGMVLVVLRAYSMGAGTYTGIEAVSNSMPLLREPRVKTGKRTMMYMAFSLALTVMGLMLAYLLFGVAPQEGKTLNAVLYGTITKDWGDMGYALLLVTLASESAILFVAAQAGFLGGPRVMANMALDRWLPTKFSMLSSRLVTQKGIMYMGGAALVTMILTQGSVKFLVVLYSINVFIDFSLSQSGMVRHWLAERRLGRIWKSGFVINLVAFVLSAFILLTVVVLKFDEGGWITLLITAGLVVVALLIKQHYRQTARMLRRLDNLVEAAGYDLKDVSELFPEKHGTATCQPLDPKARTAVLLVNGYNGLGIHTLLNVVRLFGPQFKNFAFVQIGIVDAGTFKGTEELGRLKEKVDAELELYVNLAGRHCLYGEGYSSFGTDVVEEIAKVVPEILEKHPNAVFFGGQLVFPNPSMLTGMLHNYTIFAVQRYFYNQGIPIVMMPIRV